MNLSRRLLNGQNEKNRKFNTSGSFRSCSFRSLSQVVQTAQVLPLPASSIGIQPS